MAELRTVNPLVVGSSPTLGAMEQITEYIPQLNDYCIDCKVNTLLIGEYYMVHSYVWSKANLDTYDGMLCISCLEKRLNRTLTFQDFPDLPINSLPLFRSEKLLQRLTL